VPLTRDESEDIVFDGGEVGLPILGELEKDSFSL
jgi:hypothetical protein